jgi:hypothetical protein
MNIATQSLFVFLAVIFQSYPSHAADSSWLLCDNGHIAVHAVEHRGKDGASRVSSFSLIAGMHVLSGDLKKDKTSGYIVLSSIKSGDKETSFDGDINVDYAKLKLTLKGDFQFNGNKFKLDTKLSCKTMTIKLD